MGANAKKLIVRLTMTVDGGLQKLGVSFQGVPGRVVQMKKHELSKFKIGSHGEHFGHISNITSGSSSHSRDGT